MNKIIHVLTAIIALAITSCTKSDSQYSRDLGTAEYLMQSDMDSALSILETIDPSELKIDSLRAKYHFLMAYGHMRHNR